MERSRRGSQRSGSGATPASQFLGSRFFFVFFLVLSFSPDADFFVLSEPGVACSSVCVSHLRSNHVTVYRRHC